MNIYYYNLLKNILKFKNFEKLLSKNPISLYDKKI